MAGSMTGKGQTNIPYRVGVWSLFAIKGMGREEKTGETERKTIYNNNNNNS